MDITAIETFLMLVRTRNITRTAENLYVTQPTVSHRLKLLEEELNMQLLVRKKGHKRIELTPKGESFIPVAEKWFSLMQETKRLQQSQDRVRLRVGCPNTLNSAVFSGFYRELTTRKDSSIDVNITTRYSRDIYELLENRDIDIGFVFHNLRFKNAVIKPILREKLLFVINSAKLSINDQIMIADMDPSQEVFFSWESNYQIWHEQIMPGSYFPSIEVDTYELLEEMLKEEGRWAIVPETVAVKLSGKLDLQVSRIMDKRQPPDRITYQIRHRNPGSFISAAIDRYEIELQNYIKRQFKNINIAYYS